MQEWSSAIDALDEAAKLGNTQTATYRRKAAAELDREQSDDGRVGFAASDSSARRMTTATTQPSSSRQLSTESAASHKQAPIQSLSSHQQTSSSVSSSATSSSMATSTSTFAPQSISLPVRTVPLGPTTAAATSAPASTLALPEVKLSEKIRESWYQSIDCAVVTLFVKNLTSDQVRVSFSERHAKVELLLPDGSKFDKEWTLWATIVPAASRLDVNKFKVEITLKVTKTSQKA